MLKNLLVITAGAVIGNMLANRFVLKASPDDPDGFILIEPGIGLDDVANGAVIAATIMLIKRFVP